MRVIPIPKPPLRLFVPVCFVESLNISGSVFGDEPQNNQMKWKCVIYAINKTVKGNRGSRCVSKETLSTVIKRDFIQERCEINKSDILYELYASLRWYDRAIDIHPMRTLCRIRGLYQRDLDGDSLWVMWRVYGLPSLEHPSPTLETDDDDRSGSNQRNWQGQDNS